MDKAEGLPEDEARALIAAACRVLEAAGQGDMVWGHVSVRDAGTGQLLAVSSAAMVHINAPAECARAKNASACLTAHAKSDADRKDADKKEEQL